MEDNPVTLVCEDVITLLEQSGVHKDEIQKLRELNANTEHRELLELVESYGNCMAFLDHMELTNKLATAWTAVCNKLLHERKQVVRKLRVLEADKNADAEVLENYRTRKDKADKDIAIVNVTCVRLNYLKSVPVDYNMQFPDNMLLSEADNAAPDIDEQDITDHDHEQQQATEHHDNKANNNHNNPTQHENNDIIKDKAAALPVKA